jgi:beta-galactosidase
LYFSLVFDLYRALRRAGHSVDILPSTVSDFGNCKLVLIPGLFAWNENLKTAIGAFNGQIVVGPRTGSKTEDFQIPIALPPELNGMDIKVTSVETLNPSTSVQFNHCGKFQIWREFTETNEAVSLKSNDSFPVLITKDNTHYLCGWPDEELMDRILKRVGISKAYLPDGVRIRDFGPYKLYSNYNNHSVDIGGISLCAAGIRLIDTKTNTIIIEN